MLPLLQLLLLIFTCTSMVVYVVIIAIILTHRHRIKMLRNSFFRLVVSYFVGDFLYFSEFTVFMRCRKYGYLNPFLTPNTTAFLVIPVFSNSFHYYMKIVVYIGQMYFACNRLSSALFVMKYEKYWTSHRIWLLRCIQYTLPLFFVIPVCPIVNGIFGTTFRSYYVRNDTADTIRLNTDDLSTALIAYIDCACCATATVTCLIMYSITLIVLRIHHHHQKKSLTGTEIRLLISSMLAFTILAVNCAVQVMMIVASKTGINSILFVNDLSYPVNDLMYSCQPWALLLTSSVIRQRIWGLVTRKEATQTSSSAIRTVIRHT